MKIKVAPIVIYAESENYTIAFPIECPDVTVRCSEYKLEWASNEIYKLLTGESTIENYKDRQRIILLTTLYGGAILFYKSSKGPIPLSRLHIDDRFKLEEILSNPEKLDDNSLLELWTEIFYVRKLPRRHTICPQAVILDGECIVPPVGYSAEA